MLDAHETKLEYQKWNYITLSDFRSKSFWNYISYIWLWSLAIISVATFGSDIFTCVNLLAFNNWSSQIQPYIPLNISKWIFAGCILFSFVLLAYQWLRAVRVMRRGNVAESYLDPLAVVLQSMRLGAVGKGWRRFLVFAALTKSKKGADYVALFAYFQFKTAINVVLAEGPRQVINALTLYSVVVANLGPDHKANPDQSSIKQFFSKIEFLYHQEGREQAVILSTMLFTLVVWVFSALSLLASVVLYIGFLWHYIPREDGSLSRYCRRKVNTRLERIINATAKEAIAAEEAKRKKAEEKASANAGATNGSSDFVPAKPIRQPTLPLLSTNGEMPLKEPLTRTSSISTGPPPYPSSTSEAEDGRQPTLPVFDDDETDLLPPQRLQRADSDSTVASNVTYNRRPAPPVRQLTQSTVASNVAFTRPPPPIRSGSESTVASNVTYGPPLYGQPDLVSYARPSPMPRPTGPPRSYTQLSSSSERPLLNHQPSSESISRNYTRGNVQRQEQNGPSYEMSPPCRAPTAAPPEWRSQSPIGERNVNVRPGMYSAPSARPPRPDIRNGAATPPPGRSDSPGMYPPPSSNSPRPDLYNRRPLPPSGRPASPGMTRPPRHDQRY